MPDENISLTSQMWFTVFLSRFDTFFQNCLRSLNCNCKCHICLLTHQNSIACLQNVVTFCPKHLIHASKPSDCVNNFASATKISVLLSCEPYWSKSFFFSPCNYLLYTNSMCFLLSIFYTSFVYLNALVYHTELFRYRFKQ